MHHLIGPLNIIDQFIILHNTFVHPYLLQDCQLSDRNRELWNFTKPRKEKRQMTLLSESLSSNTSGSAPDTAITDNHELKQIQGKKEEIWLGPMTTWQHKNATENFWLHNNFRQT